MALCLGDSGVLGVTRIAGTTVRTGEGGAGGALRGLVKAEGLSLTVPASSPRREAAAFSFRMAMSSSDKPGRLMLSRLKLKGAEICRLCELRFSFVAAAAAVATFDLEPMKRCSLALKLLRSMQAMVVMGSRAGRIGLAGVEFVGVHAARRGSKSRGTLSLEGAGDENDY